MRNTSRQAMSRPVIAPKRSRVALEALKKAELLGQCKMLGIKATTAQRKDALVDLILNHDSQKEDEDEHALVNTDDDDDDQVPAPSPLPVSAEQSPPPPPPATRGKGKGRSVAASTTAGSRSTRTKATDEVVQHEMIEMEDEVLMVEEPQPRAESSSRAANTIVPASPPGARSPAVSEAPTAAAPLSPAPVVLSPGPAASTSSADGDLLARLPELIAFLPLLNQLPSVLPGLATRQTNLEATAETTSASLNNLWNEVGELDGRLAALSATVDNLQGSVDNLWKELDNLDQDNTGFVRLADLRRAINKMETSWAEQFRKIADAVAGPSVSRPAASDSTSMSASIVPAVLPGKRARVESGSSSMTAPSSQFGLTGLGRSNGPPVAKRPRIVSEMAVERLISDADDDDEQLEDEDDEVVVRPRSTTPRALAASSPFRPAPPSTPPARSSLALAGRVDPTFTPSTSASASASKAAAAAAAAAHHQVGPFPLFATSPKPPRDVPLSPTFESPRRTTGSTTAASLTLTPGRALFSSGGGGGAETPRSRAARAKQQGMLPPGMNLTPGRRLAFDLATTSAASSTSPARPSAAAAGTSADGTTTTTNARPTGLSLLPSLPLDNGGTAASSSASSTLAVTPPALTIPTPSPFPFPIPPTPPRVGTWSKPKVVVPPTPPAPRTMFGTERDRDDRFGDEE